MVVAYHTEHNVHYKRVVMTRNKKNYAGVILSKEGKVFDVPDFDIKGIQIKKVSTPKLARKFFSDVLENKILNAPVIDTNNIFFEYLTFEKSIKDSILNCETKYLKPGVIKGVSAYKFPFRMEPYRAMLIWNALFPNHSIPEFSSMNIMNIKKLPGNPAEDHVSYLENLRGKLSDKHVDSLLNLFDKHEELRKTGLDVVAIPKELDKYPEELTALANTDFIISTTLSKGIILLESVGFIAIKSNKFQGSSNLIDV